VDVLVAVAGAVAMVAFWALVIIVIPGIFAVYISQIFPLTGQ